MRNNTVFAKREALTGQFLFGLLLATLLLSAQLSVMAQDHVFTVINAYAIGGVKFAYFEQGSLQLTVVPEPSTWALLVVGAVAGILLKRKRQLLNKAPCTL